MPGSLKSLRISPVMDWKYRHHQIQAPSVCILKAYCPLCKPVGICMNWTPRWMEHHGRLTWYPITTWWAETLQMKHFVQGHSVLYDVISSGSCLRISPQLL